MRIADRLKSRETFTPAENEIGRYILEHSSAVPEMSLDEFSETLYVSKSTIIRFCKKLGFLGFKELCVELARDQESFMSSEVTLNPADPLEKEDTVNSLINKITTLNYRGIADTYRDLDEKSIQRTAQILHDASAVYIYTTEEYEPFAADFANRLTALGCTVSVRPRRRTLPADASVQKAGTAALFLSYEAKETSMVRCARILKENGIPVCLICGPVRGPLERHADETVGISYYEPSPRLFPVGSRSGLLLVLDILCSQICVLDYDRNSEQLRRIADLQKGTDTPSK